MSSSSTTSNNNKDETPKDGDTPAAAPPAVAVAQRFLPDHKKQDAALTFPEKMMALMQYADSQEDKAAFCVAWLADGKSFVIRRPDEFTKTVVPKFFAKTAKFSSFTRKLYRWGFRQVNRGIGPDDPIVFGSEYFVRDDPSQMKHMRSVTAASARKQEVVGMKRPLVLLEDVQQHQDASSSSMAALLAANKRQQQQQQHQMALYDQLLLQQKLQMQQSMNMNLASVLRNAGGWNNNPNFMPSAAASRGMMDSLFLNNNNSNNNVGNNSNANNNNFWGRSSMGQSGFAAPQQQGQGQKTADIVNAAINALQFAP